MEMKVCLLFLFLFLLHNWGGKGGLEEDIGRLRWAQDWGDS